MKPSSIAACAASICVMERLGMVRSLEFDHPHWLEGSPLRRYILYRPRRGLLTPAGTHNDYR
jgi:hypothetical protein